MAAAGKQGRGDHAKCQRILRQLFTNNRIGDDVQREKIGFDFVIAFLGAAIAEM